jgi:hypothetical protein
MPQTQQSASMPKEWYDQLHELAYGQPVETQPAESDKSRDEEAKAVNWTITSALLWFIPAFRA